MATKHNNSGSAAHSNQRNEILTEDQGKTRWRLLDNNRWSEFIVQDLKHEYSLLKRLNKSVDDGSMKRWTTCGRLPWIEQDVLEASQFNSYSLDQWGRRAPPRCMKYVGSMLALRAVSIKPTTTWKGSNSVCLHVTKLAVVWNVRRSKANMVRSGNR